MLTPAERKALKARAHELEPVVIVGAKGLTDEVVKEIDLARILSRTGSKLVHQIGKVFVIYRKNDAAR